MEWASDDAKLQVGELVSAFQQAVRLRDDFSLYEIPCVVPDGSRVRLRVAMPIAFPRVKPILTVQGLTSPHANVDPAGRMSFPSLDRWASPPSRMVEVVTEAVTLLTGRDPSLTSVSSAQASQLAPSGHTGARYPPPPFFGASPPSTMPPPPPQSFAAMYGLDVRSQAPASAGIAGPSTSSRPAPPPPGHIPPMPASFASIDGLSAEELADAMRDPSKISRLAEEVVTTMGLDKVVGQARERNRVVAQEIAARAEEARSLANQVNIVRVNDYEDALRRVKDLQEAQQRLWEEIKPDRALGRLRDQMQALAGEASSLRGQILASGEESMDDTMGQYMEARKQYHQLSARVRIAQQHTA